MNFLERLIKTAEIVSINLSEIQVEQTKAPIAGAMKVQCVATNKTTGVSRHFVAIIDAETALYPELVTDWCDEVVRRLKQEMVKPK